MYLLFRSLEEPPIGHIAFVEGVGAQLRGSDNRRPTLYTRFVLRQLVQEDFGAGGLLLMQANNR